MGWNSWNAFHVPNLSEANVKAQADQMSANGMKAAGYRYVNLDSGWASGRDANGNIVVDAMKFPSSKPPLGSKEAAGLKPLADYIHKKGLKIGIYTARGSRLCDEKPPGIGALDHAKADAKMFAKWEIDYVKEDNCLASSDANDPNGFGQGNQASARAAWGYFADQINAAGREMVFAVCTAGLYNVWSWAPAVGNLWRTTRDITNQWTSVLENFETNAAFAPMEDVGTWNDPDLFEIGNGVLGPTEAQSQMSLWAISAAPLIVSTDLTKLKSGDLDILLNPEVIAIDQDPAGVQGVLVALSDDDADREVYSKILQDGSRAVLLFNKHDQDAHFMTVQWKDIGLAPGKVAVRDVVNRKMMATSSLSSFTTPEKVPARGSVLLKIGPGRLATLPFNATSFASEQVFAHQTTGWGQPRLIKRDRSVGGKAITLNGTVFPRGLGVHANSDVRFNLDDASGNPQCNSFSFVAGVDDEVGSQKGSVVFEVWGDQKKLWNSPTMSQGKSITIDDLSIAGHHTLKLRVTDHEDGIDNDHADWANAKITCGFPDVISYEAESADHGKAKIKTGTNHGYSADQYVGDIGKQKGAAVTFKNVQSPSAAAGMYVLGLYYVDGDANGSGRTMFMRVNGGPQTSFETPGNGDWRSVQNLSVPVQLKAGNNTIELFNDGASAADIDRITLGPPPGPTPPAPNACGGSLPLQKPPGTTCEEGGQCGRWRCLGPKANAVTCDTSLATRNECGGCTPIGIPGAPGGKGTSCPCNDAAQTTGFYVCGPAKTLICCPCHSAPGCGPGGP